MINLLIELACVYRLFKYRARFRPAIRLIENAGWSAGVEYDAKRRLYLGYIIVSNGSIYLPNNYTSQLMKMRWFSEWHVKHRSHSWKTILD